MLEMQSNHIIFNKFRMTVGSRRGEAQETQIKHLGVCVVFFSSTVCEPGASQVTVSVQIYHFVSNSSYSSVICTSSHTYPSKVPF